MNYLLGIFDFIGLLAVCLGIVVILLVWLIVSVVRKSREIKKQTLQKALAIKLIRHHLTGAKQQAVQTPLGYTYMSEALEQIRKVLQR